MLALLCLIFFHVFRNNERANIEYENYVGKPEKFEETGKTAKLIKLEEKRSGMKRKGARNPNPTSPPPVGQSLDDYVTIQPTGEGVQLALVGWILSYRKDRMERCRSYSQTNSVLVSPEEITTGMYPYTLFLTYSVSPGPSLAFSELLPIPSRAEPKSQIEDPFQVPRYAGTFSSSPAVMVKMLTWPLFRLEILPGGSNVVFMASKNDPGGIHIGSTHQVHGSSAGVVTYPTMNLKIYQQSETTATISTCWKCSEVLNPLR
ncbi:hypothetical protein G9A89_012920 [Geosiphon pyriformis]|nr:hypothetical protein G9A89_012920 [Geosiphon pyriformis]